jgi:hypothetical protein
MSAQPLADLEAELEWRRARTLPDAAERAANEARIANLVRLIAEPRGRSMGGARGSPTALIIVLVSFAIVGAFVSYFARSRPQVPADTIRKSRAQTRPGAALWVQSTSTWAYRAPGADRSIRGRTGQPTFQCVRFRTTHTRGKLLRA